MAENENQTEPTVTKEVKHQQEKVAKADALVFIYPIWWWGMPAILKGWIDRVFQVGFAYKLTDKGVVGLLRNRKALVVNTTGSSETFYRKTGFLEVIEKTIDEGILKSCGIKDVRHVYFYDVLSNKAARKKYLEYAYRLGNEL
jgi:NAD(P)H dehydrogenase (quinone)